MITRANPKKNAPIDLAAAIENLDEPSFQTDWLSREFQPDLVSVIIPTYNREYLIKDTIQSVLKQSYRPLELIVVDDGSSDNTQLVINQFMKENGSLFYTQYIFQGNKGAASARNRGLAASHGEFIQFLDSDDILHPQKILTQINFSREHPEALYCGAWLTFPQYPFNQAELICGNWINVNQDIIEQWLGYRYFIPASLLWHRTCISKIGPWDESLSLNDDGEYFLRTVIKNIPLFFVEEAVSYYRNNIVNEKALSQDRSRKGIISSIRVMEKLRYNLYKTGILYKYRGSLAAWYYKTAENTSETYSDISKWCIEQGNCLYPDSTLLWGRLVGTVFGKKIRSAFFSLFNKIYR